MQTLVDILVFFAPFALYPKVGAWSIPLAALITYFYCGLLELSKSFFDIFGREGYFEQTINVEVLICEVNSAASRWVQAGRVAPRLSKTSSTIAKEGPGTRNEDVDQ